MNVNKSWFFYLSLISISKIISKRNLLYLGLKAICYFVICSIVERLSNFTRYTE